MSKWFFALSEASFAHPAHDWVSLIRTAVASARANTTLKPFFIYDGAASGFTAELQRAGVTIIHHQVSYLGNIVARSAEIGLPPDPMRLAITAGAYLRTEIPRLGFNDEFVLYTDCDIMFLADPEIDRFKPTYFACAPQRLRNDPTDINSGVMVLNIPAMQKELANFYHFIVQNFERFGAFDQDALREYYAGRYDSLPLELNWKPYWGINPNAKILHFHGPKPSIVRQLLANPDYPAPEIYRELFQENPAAYQEYVVQWSAMNPNQPLEAPAAC